MQRPRMIAAALSTFSSNEAAAATAAWAAGAARAIAPSTRLARSRLFGVIPVENKARDEPSQPASSSTAFTLREAAMDELRHDGQRLRRHVMSYRQFVIVRLDAMLFEQAAGATR